MKSQYPNSPVTYQCSEPLNYLQTFSHIRQFTAEKAEQIKSDCRPAAKAESAGRTATDEKEEEEGLSSFFYAQSFTPSNED